MRFMFVTTILFSFCIFNSCESRVRSINNKPKDFLVERNNSMELIDLLDKFTESNDWSVQAEDPSILWKTGVEMGSNSVPEYIPSYFSKVGNTYLTIDGEFMDFYYRQTKMPVSWTINLYGSRTMYNYVVVKMMETGSGHLFLEDYLQEKEMLLEQSCYKFKDRDQSGYGISNFTKLKILLPSKRTIFVIHEALYMNNVCDQALYFNCDGSEDILLPPEFEEFYSDQIVKCN